MFFFEKCRLVNNAITERMKAKIGRTDVIQNDELRLALEQFMIAKLLFIKLHSNLIIFEL